MAHAGRRSRVRGSVCSSLIEAHAITAWPSLRLRVVLGSAELAHLGLQLFRYRIPAFSANLAEAFADGSVVINDRHGITLRMGFLFEPTLVSEHGQLGITDAEVGQSVIYYPYW